MSHRCNKLDWGADKQYSTNRKHRPVKSAAHDRTLQKRPDAAVFLQPFISTDQGKVFPQRSREYQPQTFLNGKTLLITEIMLVALLPSILLLTPDRL